MTNAKFAPGDLTALRVVFRWILFAIVGGILLAGSAAASRGTEPRPNVLWIIGDDLAAHALASSGNARAQTGNCDRLATAGARFTRAFCNSPVCTASRQSLLTGKYPRTLGVTELATPLPEDELTLAERLAAAGYETAAYGKMHFNSGRTHGFASRLDLADHARWLADLPPLSTPPGREVLGTWRPFRDPAAVWLNSRTLPVGLPIERTSARYFAERAAEFLRAPRERPFFLVVSFYEPHSPFHFPAEFSRHRSEEFPVPPVSPVDAGQVPAVFRELTASEKQGIAAAYHNSVEFLDAQIGRVLEALDQSGHRDQTLLMLTGDNGYLLGQHGRFEKHCSWEEAIRVPLLLAWPGRIAPETVSDDLVELIDVVPTTLAACGLPADPELPGRDLVPQLAAGQSAGPRVGTDAPVLSGRSEVVVEYAPNEEACLRERRWKLVYRLGRTERRDGYATGQPPAGPQIELFDLEADPGETTNLARDAAQVDRVESMLDRLTEHLVSTARRPERIPRSGTREEKLASCLVPDDVVP